jgi:hypothetical protein
VVEAVALAASVVAAWASQLDQLSSLSLLLCLALPGHVEVAYQDAVNSD